MGRIWPGNKLDGSTAFTIGAAVTPEADPLGPMLAKFEVKVKAGAQFFQTQAIYHPEQFASFMKAVRPFKAKVLAGILVLRNAKMAEFMNANIPGMSVPQEMIDELKAAGRERQRMSESILRCGRSRRCDRTATGFILWRSRPRTGWLRSSPKQNWADDDPRVSAAQTRQEEARRRHGLRRAVRTHCRTGRH